MLLAGFGFAGNQLNRAQAIIKANTFLAEAGHNSTFSNGMDFSIAGVSDFRIKDENLAYIVHLKPQGFIIVSNYNQPSPIIGFSMESNFPDNAESSDLPVFNVVKGIALSMKSKANKAAVAKPSYKNTSEVIYGPYVTTLWGQVNCQNNQGSSINVTNYYTPNHYAAGCVAISMATLLHHYQWPLKGVGSHSYYDGYGSSNGNYSADFGNTNYSWDDMLYKYNNQASTTVQQEAAGELAFHAAVALEMDFEYNGSTSNVNKIPGCGADYFRFYSFYKSESSTVFWPRLDKNMTEANPVILSVSSNSGYGHSVVCDGLWLTDSEERFYHLNMGWWGSGNGWFTIHEDFNAGGYTSIGGGILDFIPMPILNDALIAPDTNMFHLNWVFTQVIEADAYEVQRKINTGSWQTIADDYPDTSLLIVVENLTDDIYFRVRAKVNGDWYPASWSNEVQLDILTNIMSFENDKQVSVYPNPFNENFTIEYPEVTGRPSSIKIYNAAGLLYYETNQSIHPEGVNISSGTWPKGLYFIDVNTGNTHQLLKTVKQ